MALTPITGASKFYVGAVSTYSNATSGGVWSSGDEAVLTIDSVTGEATGIVTGATQVIYTLDTDSTALNVSIQAAGVITNGFNPSLVIEALGTEVLWKSQGTSTSGRYFQDFHPICNEEIVTLLANNVTDYPTFLTELTNSVVLECVNSVYNKSQLIDSSRLCFNRSDVMLVTQPVNNQVPPVFAGLKLQLAHGDYGIKLSNLMLFFTEDVTFNMYLYNDMNFPPLYTIRVTAKAYQQVIVPLQNDRVLNYLTPSMNKGGIWYFGYYQADLGTAKAIYYPVTFNLYHPVSVWSFSAPTYIDPLGQTNFRRNVVGANNLTYGLNLEIATMVDATNNIVSNPSLWDNMIGYKMACKIIQLCMFSYRTNGVQNAVQSLGGLEELNTQLNGKPYSREFGTPKITGLIEQVKEAANTVKEGFQPTYTGGIGMI
jgi:hypothetical protein